MTTALRHAVVSALLVLACAGSARAQGNHMFAAGVGYSATMLNGDSWKGSPDWFIFRLPRPEHLGIAWDIGSDTYPVPANATPSQAVGSPPGSAFPVRTGLHVARGPGGAHDQRTSRSGCQSVQAR